MKILNRFLPFLLFISIFSVFFFPSLLYAQSTPWSFYNNPLQSNAMDIFYNGIGAVNPAVRIQSNGQFKVNGALGANSGATFQHSNGTQGVTIGYTGIGKLTTNGNNNLNIDAASTGVIALNANGGTGNVGIGTNTPGQLLQVGSSGVNNSSGVIRQGTCNSNCSGNRSWDTGVSFPLYGNYNYNIRDASMSTIAVSVAYGSGYVGINTVAPLAPLTIEGGAGDQLQFYKATEDGLAIQTTLNSQPISTYGGDLPNRLLLQPVVGNVGIGTTQPQGKLHIIGNGEDGLLFYNPGNDLFGIQTTLNNQANNGYGGTANKLSLQPVAGFVGIHKSNPISDLHIKQSSDSPYAGGILLENVAGNLAPIFLGADAKTNVYSGSSGGFIRINTGGGVENNSSKLIKENFTTLNFDDVLNKIDQLPVMEWNFKNQDASIRHIGPFAEDFYSIFGLNDDNKTINAPDAAGVTLAGVKALSEKSKKQQNEIELLKQEIESLKQDLRKLQK